MRVPGVFQGLKRMEPDEPAVSAGEGRGIDVASRSTGDGIEDRYARLLLGADEERHPFIVLAERTSPSDPA